MTTPLRMAVVALADALGDQPPPCWERGDRWFADPVAAARLCSGCHALAECGTYADLLRPHHGVWAGINYDSRRTP